MNPSITFLFLLLAGSAFSQSKKELQAEIARKNATIDSLQNRLADKSKAFDTLALSFVKVQKNYLHQLEIVNDLSVEYRNCQQKTAALEQENAKLKSNKEPVKTNNTSNTSTRKDSPFSDIPFSNAPTKGTEVGADHKESRYMIAKPDVSNIVSKETCTITFTVTIDENGSIINSPTVVEESTTTENTVLIQQIAAVVKSQAKFNKSPGSKNTKGQISVQVKAQ